jgi:hypothetical protein
MQVETREAGRICIMQSKMLASSAVLSETKSKDMGVVLTAA